ncbi:UDP-N-acetylmuramate dehydrogenase [Rheinheimera riviphila]|uniref:UDP-N-acetylenolpyruvoylglucosamine reductase n=1 Tax=Rheinheimera riviphila TaxID=1834037 RepID=A0A437QEM5_9GAMM|nr:UDP-N-acetylmuramate dehydrogenase [Rheinheimera riviphila]RVU32997.1 UDP-N-acetylmuramate dehydrogenase [Rheinheimera riviphila]
MQQLLAQDARRYSTFRLAATLSQVIKISSLAELQRYQPLQPPLVLGEGSNCIFLSDWHTDILRFVADSVIRNQQGETLMLHVEAGCNWHQLVQNTVAEGWWGLENLALIPGSVGAAPVQNIGAYGVEMADCCTYVDFFHWQTKSVQRLSREECVFGYRDSIFKHSFAGKGVIVAVGFQLQRKGVPRLSYKGLDHLPLDSRPLDVMHAVIAVRQSKLPDPATLANCGSFFKNPLLSANQFQALIEKHPTLPHYPQPDSQVKVAAAWLIEQAGLKGHRIGDVACYPLQPLVLVNYGAGTSAQLSELIQLIQRSVQQMFDILLEPEVRLLTQDD